MDRAQAGRIGLIFSNLAIFPSIKKWVYRIPISCPLKSPLIFYKMKDLIKHWRGTRIDKMWACFFSLINSETFTPISQILLFFYYDPSECGEIRFKNQTHIKWVKTDVPSIEKPFFDAFQLGAHEVVKKPLSVRVLVEIIDYKRCGLQIRRNAEKGLYRAEVIRD